MVTAVIYEKEFVDWRFNLRLYNNLYLFRTVIIKIEPCVWWLLAKRFRNLKRHCSTMIQLLYGSTCLRLYSDHQTKTEERFCQLCDCTSLEDTKHFKLECPFFNQHRILMYNNITENVSADSYIQFQSFSLEMQLYILLGLEVPLPQFDIDII